MKLFLAGLATLALGRVVEKNEPFTEAEYWTLWKHFQTLEGPTTTMYKTNAEHTKRFNIFKKNMDTAREHNSEGHSFSLGVTAFADLSEEEFKSWISKANGYKPTKSKSVGTHEIVGSAPASMDWTTQGAVTPIKNQGQCGSCWSFSTTGSLEGQNFLKNHKLSSFSEQELVSCSGSPNMGCNGGSMDAAFEWIEKNGLCYESAYPYTSGGGSSGTCEKSTCKSEITVTGFTDVESGSTDGLKDACGTVGPISVAVNANTKWQMYTGGIFAPTMFYPCSKDKLDHGVLLVGYTDSYWKVKNSWGASWGEEGFIRLQPGNTCGIAQDASYPLL